MYYEQYLISKYNHIVENIKLFFIKIEKIHCIVILHY